MKLALCGNPNVGKTTLFNRLTRSDAPVGNWHGVTVDSRQKRIKGTGDVLVDLPGAYSLTSRSKEETITRDGVLYGDFDAVVYVAEVNNLRRNLYLLTQVAEAEKKAILIVNMMDEARGEVDLGLLSTRLGIPVIGTSERDKDPTPRILDAVKRAAVPILHYAYDDCVARAEKHVRSRVAGALATRFAAMKLLEGDPDIVAAVGELNNVGCAACGGCGGKVCDIPAALRYGYIDDVLRGVTVRGKAYARTDKIDKIVLGKAALPIFIAVMAAVFMITFEAGKPLSALLMRLVDIAGHAVKNTDMPEWVCGFLGDGVIGGAGAVLAFLPQVVLLFLLTALIQDSGYMSRVAFVTDGFFKKFGLSGRAAFSLVLGLGCSATAVLSTRGIAETDARRRTAFVLPFVPCSARLAVFTAFCSYFAIPSVAVAAMYVLGVFAALVTLRIIKSFGKTTVDDALLMEMPPYRLPSFKRVIKSVLSNICSFVVRVGSVVLGVSAIMWILSNFSLAYGFTNDGEASIMSTFAGSIAVVFKPLGFGNWRAVAALLSGIAAKETVVSVIASLGGMGIFGTRLSAISFLIFSCLYVPCVATLAALAKENGIKSALLSVCVHTLVAYLASLTFYQSAVLFRIDLRAFITIYTCVAIAICAAIVACRIKRAKEHAKREKSPTV